MSEKELLKDLAKLAEKNGMKRIVVICDKGILFEDANMELVKDLMLALNLVMARMVSEGKLNVDQIRAIFEDYGWIVQNNIRNSINSEKLKKFSGN
jgi:hypothetical protein